MAFDFTAIFGDAESMTKEQLETALQQKGIKLADLGTGKYVDAGKYQSAVSELDQLKQSKMTDAEKQAADIAAIKAQNAALMKDRRKSKIESELAKNGIKADGYSKLIDKFSDMEDEDAMAGAQTIIDTYNAEKESITTQIRQELMQSMKQPSGGGSGDGQKEFSKMTMQERMELKQRNPELYKAESAKLAKHF